MASRLAAAGLAVLLAACTTPGLSQFEATLAANDSATAALGQWCGTHQFAAPPTIRATRIPDAGQAAPGDTRRLLGVSGCEPLGYRHVRLSCGSRVLSEAHNWYVPARLTPQMNAALSDTDTPFGTVASPLRFRRERLSSQRGRGPGCPAGTILTHRAVLRLPDGRPLALVVECYTPANLHGRPALNAG